MTDELKTFLNENRKLIEQEDYQLLQDACPEECQKELRLLLLECNDYDTSIIHQSFWAKALQDSINKYTSDIFVIRLVMCQPHKYSGDRYVGELSYTILMNNKIYDDVFEYDVVAPKLPRAASILEECGERFVHHVKEVHND